MNSKSKVKTFNVDFDEIASKTSNSSTSRDSTPVSKMMEQSNDQKKIKENRREKILIEVDPSRTVMWKYADRTESDEELDLSDLEVSMAPGKKQLLPALARKVSGIDGVDYELVYGRRRRVQCVRANRKLVIELTEDEDKECLRYMKQENDDRIDITKMQKARSYNVQFNDGIYKSIRDMSENLGVPLKTLSRLIKAGGLWHNAKLSQLIGNVKDMGVYDAEEIMTIREGNSQHFNNVIDTVLSEGKTKGMPASLTAKTIINILKEKESNKLDKTYTTLAGSIKVKTDQRGDITMKLPREFIALNKDKVFELIKSIRADLV